MQELNTKKYTVHIILFLVTIITTTLAGAEWIYGRSFIYGENLLGWEEFLSGFEYSIPFLLILTVHEFGHYLVAKNNQVQVTLPYYLPMWFGFLPTQSLGTFGAFIKMGRSSSKRQMFDIGIAGPLAGFVVAVFVLAYGYTHLPNQEYIYNIHPDYEQFGNDYANHVYKREHHVEQHKLLYLEARAADSIAHVNSGEQGEWYFEDFEPFEEYPSMSMQKPLLMVILESTLVADRSLIPNVHEMMHYPWLLAGFFALLFTALNLMPVGQLDGGHVLYGLVGYKKHKIIATIVFMIFLFYAGLGLFSPYHPVERLMWIPVYLFFLYWVLQSAQMSKVDTIMYAFVIFAGQFLLSWLKPEWEGYLGWSLFAIIVGRFLGIMHPPVQDEMPLDTNRKILGWIALLVFILSVSPAPMVIS